MSKIIAATLLAGVLVAGPMAIAAHAEDVPMQSAGTAGEHTNAKGMVKKSGMMKKGHHAKTMKKM